MTPEQMGKLTQEFSQADACTTRKYMVAPEPWARDQQRFCQMMGGDITVDNRMAHHPYSPSRHLGLDGPDSHRGHP